MRKGLLAVFGLIVLAGVAWWAGTSAGEKLTVDDKEKHFQRQKEITESIIEQNKLISIGERWPDPMLQNLDGEWKRVSELLRDTTLLIIIRPGCDACEEELDILDDLLSDQATSSRAIIISDSYPLDLAQVRQSRGIKSQMLVDRDKELFHLFNTIAFPLNILITSDRYIVSVVVGSLSRKDAEQVMF